MCQFSLEFDENVNNIWSTRGEIVLSEHTQTIIGGQTFQYDISCKFE